MASIAMPLADGFEDSELRVPHDRLIEAGHHVVVIGRRDRKAGDVLEGKRGGKAFIERTADEVEADAFDAVVIAGGYSPDRLRTDPTVVELVRRLFEEGRPVAAICHGPQLLIEAGVVAGCTLTSWPSVRTDLENAGATWVDRALAEDRHLITSRKPDDLDVFVDAILARL